MNIVAHGSKRGNCESGILKSSTGCSKAPKQSLLFIGHSEALVSRERNNWMITFMHENIRTNWVDTSTAYRHGFYISIYKCFKLLCMHIVCPCTMIWSVNFLSKWYCAFNTALRTVIATAHFVIAVLVELWNTRPPVHEHSDCNAYCCRDSS